MRTRVKQLSLATTDLLKLIGQVLDEDLVNEHGAVLLPSGSLVTQHEVDKIMMHRIHGMPHASPVDYGKVVARAIDELDSVFQSTRYRENIRLIDVQRNVIPLVSQVVEHPNVNRLLGLLQVKDNYTVSHSFAVSVLASMIGRWLQLCDADLAALMMASTLHDIGKVKVPDHILNKPGKLTEDEYQMMKRHTVFGYELISNTVGTSHRQALAALQHHERMDGSGYPFRLQGRDISLFGKIIGIADVFHAMSSKRVYHDPKPMYEILLEMKEGIFGQFDVALTNLFLVRMMEGLIGSEVVLSDGRTGSIVMIQQNDPIRPLVQVGETFVDTSMSASVQIERVEG